MSSDTRQRWCLGFHHPPMNTAELSDRLRHELRSSGRTEWELSRRSNVKLSLVEQVLQGSALAPVEALVRIADSLELDIALTRAQPSAPAAGEVPTVVDVVRERLQRPPVGSVEAFISEERVLLSRLEVLVGSRDYAALLDAIRTLTGEAPLDWVGEWLIRPAFSLGARPIDILQQEGGFELVKTHAFRFVTGIGP